MPQTAPSPLTLLDTVIAAEVAPHARSVDQEGRFPREAIAALGRCGILGLVSSTSVGGAGASLAEAAQVVERLGQVCSSTAMVVCMHYAATAVIEVHGPQDIRRAIAAGRHLSTLAFSEAGSRAHFWAPMSTATAHDDTVQLDARKSWVTSASQADSYVWSSRSLDGKAISLWLVDRTTPGLAITGAFDGLGLRGNDSVPVTATDARIPLARRLGDEGQGFGVMMGVVLPWFQVMNAAMSLGLMQAVIEATIRHATVTRYEHLAQSLAEQPQTRARIAGMRVRADQARALWLDTLAAIASQRADQMLRVLQVKLAANEAALEVTDQAMRVCGGAAFRREVGVERWFRDARAAAVMAPTSDALTDFIGKAVCGLPLF